METTDQDRTGGPLATGSIALSNTAEFIQDMGRWTDSLPTTENALLARQMVVYPNTTVSFIIPPEPVLKNVRFECDVTLEYPWTPQPIPIGLNAYKNALTDQNVVTDPLTRTMYATLGDLQQKAACVPDYAMDYPTLIGNLSLFDRWSLSLNNGTPIDEMTAARGYQFLQGLRAHKLHGAELQKFDAIYKSQLLQWAPGLDTSLVPPLGTSGSARATHVEVDRAARVIRVRQHHEIPLPLYIGNDILARWWGGGQNLQLDVVLAPFNPLDNRAATRIFSGYMNTVEHSVGWFPAGNINVETEKIQPVKTPGPNDTNTRLSLLPPILNYGTRIAYPNAVEKRYDFGIQSYLAVCLSSVILDTADLTAVIGDAHLTVDGFYVGAGNQTDRPTCSMRNSGLTLLFQLAHIDSPQVSFSPAEEKWQAVEIMTGVRQLRHQYASYFVPAGLITDISLAINGGVPNPVASQDELSGHVSNLQDVSEAGSAATRVRITFAAPITIHLPIFNADYNPIRKTQTTIDGVSPPSTFRTRMPINVFSDQTNTGTGLDESNLLGVKFGINFLACTNLPIAPGLPVEGTTGAIVPNVWADGNYLTQPTTAPAPTHQFLPALTVPTTAVRSGPMVVYPTSRVLTNVRLRYQKPELPSGLVAELDDLYNSEGGPGIRVTRAVVDSEPHDLISYGSREIAFNLLGGSVRYPYFIWFALRPASTVSTAEPARPVATFSYFNLLQATYQVVNIVRKEQLQCLGNMWPINPPYLGSSANPNWGNVLMGKGGNSQIISRWAEAFGNTEQGTSARRPDDPGFNASLFNYMGWAKDSIYGMNVSGGCADIQAQTQFKVSFALMAGEKSRVGHGVQTVFTAHPNGAQYTPMVLNFDTIDDQYQVVPLENGVDDYADNGPLHNFDFEPIRAYSGSTFTGGFCRWKTLPTTKLFDDHAQVLIRLHIAVCYRCEWVFKSGGKDAAGQTVPLVLKLT